MPIEILMPALSPTMEKGTLARWHVKEGDKVAPGDVVAEIETDKATMEVESVDEGTVAAILVAEGTADVPVNTVIATLEGEGAPAKARSAGIPTTSVPPSPVTGAPATIPGGGATPSQPAPGGGATPSQPAPGGGAAPSQPAPRPSGTPAGGTPAGEPQEVTADQLRTMTPEQISKLPQAAIDKALGRE